MNAYDAVPYAGRPYPQTHPDRLAAVATLAGMTPAPVERCRVLEIACGDAANLIPMAYALPGSEFVGFDLAARAVESGKRLAGQLGLSNLALTRLDLADFPPDAGQFDYIVAHGLYSWIPADTRDRLLALLGSHLAPHGVAYVSYNTYPGCYVRRMAWEMLRFHTDQLVDPQARVAEAQALARLIATGRRVHDEHSPLLKLELEQLVERDPAHLVHDDLAGINDPVYFHEFIEHAQRHDLQFLGEAELAASGYASVTLQARHVLEGLDPLTREQYVDFVLCRRFRQTLLCRADVALDRTTGAAGIAALFLAARQGVAVTPRAPDEHEGAALGDADARTTRDTSALLKALLDVLEEAAPRRLVLDEIAGLVGTREGGERLRELGPERFRQLAFGAARAGAVVLHAGAPRLVTEPGERPAASAIARLQAAAGGIVTTLCHGSVNVDDETARRLLPLLDGTLTRSELATALGTVLGGESTAVRMVELEAHLRHLARLALLIA